MELVADIATNAIFLVASGAASIFSFCFTTYIMGKLLNINAQILFSRRVDQWIQTLRRQSGQLAPALQPGFGSVPQIASILGRCRPSLHALTRVLPWSSVIRWKVISLLIRIAKIRNDNILRLLPLIHSAVNRERDVYERILELIEDLKELRAAQAAMVKV